MPITVPPSTLLAIIPISGGDAFGLPLYAARGITQTLEPITGLGGAGGDVMGTLIRRDINGNLIDLTYPQFRKYQSIITCKDTEAPAMDDGWLGQRVEVHCACELSFPTGRTAQRPEVTGSVRTEGLYTFYRPILFMMVTGVRNGFSEYPADYQWQLNLQEL